MIVNQDDTYIYLTVPKRFNCVYEKLLAKLSELGVDMIKDCGSTCRGINKHIINCWNMFQTACAAHTLGEDKKANLLINYINGQLNLECPCVDDAAPTPQPEPQPEPDPDPTPPPVVKGRIDIKLTIPSLVDGVGYLDVDVDKIKVDILLIDGAKAKANSIALYEKGNSIPLATGLNGVLGEVDLTIPIFHVNMHAGSSKSYYVTILDTKGNTYTSHDYVVNRTVPIVGKEDSIWYGLAGATVEEITGGMKATGSTFIWDKPGKVNNIYFAYPDGKQITNMTSNPNTIPDVNLYSKLFVEKTEVTINNTPYIIEKVRSGAYFNYPIKITIA